LSLAIVATFHFLAGPVARAQCAGIATTPASAADCAKHAFPQDREAVLNPAYPYSLAELIDIAELNNPRTHIVWERARQAAERLGIARSAYFPVLSGLAAIADSRVIEPFPEPLATRGYVMVEVPAVVPEITLDYLLFDFGKREAKVDAAAALKLAAGANFIRANQEVAFRVATTYYKLRRTQQKHNSTMGAQLCPMSSTQGPKHHRLSSISSQQMVTRKSHALHSLKQLVLSHLPTS
jgi:outer membrane protein TolC